MALMLCSAKVQRSLLCCRIPVPYLVNTKKFLAPELPEAPLIVFINSKSGGHAGPQLTEVLYHTLGHAQVGTPLSLCWGTALQP